MSNVDDVSITAEIIKPAPGATYVVAYQFMGLTPEGWITFFTLAYLIIQLLVIAPKLIATYKPWVNRRCLALTMLIKSKSKDKDNV